MNRVAAVILAAGSASRFRAAGGLNETKLIAKLEGKPIVRMVAESALASKASPVVAVVGHARRAIETALAGLPVTIAFNPDFAAGIASSLGVGLAALPPDVAGAIVMLGDMPRVDARMVDALIDGFLARPEAHAAAPLQGGRRGNPVLLGRVLFEAAMRLTGDEGARRLVAALSDEAIVEIETKDTGVAFDVDTPEDLLRNGS